jgi:hypothetical protein
MSILGAGLFAGTPGVFGGTPGEVPLEDILQILVFEREIVAVDARGGGETRARLELGETVASHSSRGQVAVALTNRRILAVGASSGSWQDAAFRKREQLIEAPVLGDRVALVITTLRVLGFDGGSGNLVETRLGVSERTVARAVDSNVAIAVTDRRALGLSPFRGGLFEIPLYAKERLVSVEASGNMATVRTHRRLLTFRAPSGTWSQRRLSLEDGF